MLRGIAPDLRLNRQTRYEPKQTTRTLSLVRKRIGQCVSCAIWPEGIHSVGHRSRSCRLFV